MKKTISIIAAIILFTRCVSNSTKLDSDDYVSKPDRIKILKEEIKFFSDFQDAEFELFNVNGFHNQQTFFPGASSWDYKFVVKTDTTHISKWTNGMQLFEPTNYNDKWTTEIIKHRKQNWITYSKPQYFTRQNSNVTMLVFKNEGIIYKRITDL